MGKKAWLLSKNWQNKYNGVFLNSYIKRKDSYDLAQFENIRWFDSKDKVFKQSRFDSDSKSYFDFSLDSISPARNIAEVSTASRYTLDLNGKSRFVDGQPDAGCYEW